MSKLLSEEQIAVVEGLLSKNGHPIPRGLLIDCFLLADKVRWKEMDTAPKHEAYFLCHKKSEPHIQFEAFIYKECESWENPREYNVLYNATQDCIIDEPWLYYEWSPLL